MQLKMNFNQASKGSHSMADFLNYIKSIADSLHAIGRQVVDDDIILQILSSLPQEYGDVVNVMTAHKLFPSFLELRSFFLVHEQRVL